jgi:hypothetical protein
MQASTVVGPTQLPERTPNHTIGDLNRDCSRLLAACCPQWGLLTAEQLQGLAGEHRMQATELLA